MNKLSYSLYFDRTKDVREYCSEDVKEIIIEHKKLSRFGTSDTNEILDSIEKLKSMNKKISLEWDILMLENEFLEAVNVLKKLPLGSISSIRCQDPGAIYFLNEYLQDKETKITPILETGNHNSLAIGAWIRLLGDKLDKVVLSLELPKDELKKIVNEFDVPFELMGFGKILLFYTPRRLVSPQFIDHDDETTVKVHDEKQFLINANSEETPHRGFSVLENNHGTFMFHPNEHCLLDCLDDLELSGIKQIKVDLRFTKELSFENLMQVSKNGHWKEFKRDYPRRLIRGFFSVNKSTSVFPKLKNYRLMVKDDNFLGEVLDVKKGSHIAFMGKKNLKFEVGTLNIQLNTPDGKTKKLKVSRLTNLEGEKVDAIEHDKVYVLPHVSGVSIRTLIYSL